MFLPNRVLLSLLSCVLGLAACSSEVSTRDRRSPQTPLLPRMQIDGPGNASWPYMSLSTAKDRRTGKLIALNAHPLGFINRTRVTQENALKHIPGG